MAEFTYTGENSRLRKSDLKTINGTSIVGSGDITISGGGSGDTNIIETVKVNNVALTPDANKAVNIDLSSYDKAPLVIEVNDTDTTVPSGTYASITAALAAGREVYAKVTYTQDDSEILYLKLIVTEGVAIPYIFGGTSAVLSYQLIISSNDSISFDRLTLATGDHIHGNILNNGTLTTDATIASGDKILITDSSSSNQIKRTSISFDGSTTTTALTPKGTWEPFLKTAPVTSVNGQTGAVTLALGDTNVIETVKVNGTALTPDANKAVNIPLVSASANGLMSIADKEKLDSVKTWATKDVEFASSGRFDSLTFYSPVFAEYDNNIALFTDGTVPALITVIHSAAGEQSGDVNWGHAGDNALGTIGFIRPHIEAKQDTLVSGTNIKTINNTSILGSGNITIKANVQSDWNATSGDAAILNKPDIPDEKLSSSYQTSTLENDNLLLAGGDTYETAFSKIEKAILDNEETIAASLNDLNTRKIEIDDVPTKISELINDAGYLTSFTEEDPVFSASAAAGISNSDITIWNDKVNRSGDTINGTLEIKPDGGGSALELNTTNQGSTAVLIEAGRGDSSNYHVITRDNNDNLIIGDTGHLVNLVTGSKVGNKTIATTDLIPTIPTNVSTFTNDAGYLTSFTETDPTVPAWAKAANKPTYTASEVGALPDTTVIPAAPGTLNTTATTAQSTSSSEALSGNITLHKVAKTGTYNDLIGKPTIPAAVTESTVSGWGFTKNAGTITGITMNGVSKGTSGVVDLGTVITSETALSKGTTTGSGNAVTDISVSGHQITLTKGTTFLTSHQGIKTLKTDNTTAQSTSSSETIAGSGTINLHKVAKTGTYSDLIGTPTIPTVNNATLTIQKNGTTVNTFTANASSNVTANIQVNELPTVSSSDNGKILQVVNGAWALVTPTSIYSGTSEPDSNTGNNGDLYLQTS